MTTLKVHNIESAPEASKGLLEGSQSIRNDSRTARRFGRSPGILDAYQKLHELFVNSSFNEEELTVVWQSINVEHACHYCVPAHTGIAAMMKVDEAITEALRNETL
jgi:alkylhydroperoxidase family enzyme